MNVRVELVAREGTPEAARKRGKAAWNRSQPHILRHLSKRHFQRHINESSTCDVGTSPPTHFGLRPVLWDFWLEGKQKREERREMVRSEKGGMRFRRLPVPYVQHLLRDTLSVHRFAQNGFFRNRIYSRL